MYRFLSLSISVCNLPFSLRLLLIFFSQVAAVELQRLCAAETMMNDYFAPQGINGKLLDLPPRVADGLLPSTSLAVAATSNISGNNTDNSVSVSAPKNAGVISPDVFLANSALALRRDLAEASYMPRGDFNNKGLPQHNIMFFF